jgi:hypothetical protein
MSNFALKRSFQRWSQVSKERPFVFKEQVVAVVKSVAFSQAKVSSQVAQPQHCGRTSIDGDATHCLVR